MVRKFGCGDQCEGFRGDALRVLDEVHGVLKRSERESSFVASYVDLGNRVVLIVGKDAPRKDELVGVTLKRESSASVALPLGEHLCDEDGLELLSGVVLMVLRPAGLALKWG